MGDDPWQNSEELAFIPEQVEPMLTNVLAAVLANEVYEDAKVPVWIDSICEKSMESLAKLSKPFKYIGRHLRIFPYIDTTFHVVTCLIIQKNGAGIHSAQSCFWDVR